MRIRRRKINCTTANIFPKSGMKKSPRETRVGGLPEVATLLELGRIEISVRSPRIFTHFKKFDHDSNPFARSIFPSEIFHLLRAPKLFIEKNSELSILSTPIARIALEGISSPA
jgi:hypothetical protein